MALKIATIGCWLMLIGAMLCSCSSDDDTATQEDSNGRRLRQLTIANATMMTRATIDPTSLSAAWQTTDKPVYVNLSLLPGEVRYGNLTPTAAGVTTTLTGNVYCGNGDDIAVIFPAVTPEKPAGDAAYFTINLSGQKGTLEDIGAHYHYVYGVASGITVNGNTASGTIDKMKSLLSLCKFNFTHDGSPVNVASVQIGWGETGAVGYPKTGTALLAAPEGVHAKSDAPDGPLTITLDTPTEDGVYVALFPCDDRLTFHFTVSDGTNSYTATKTAKMLEGKYYEVDIALE